MNRRVGNGGTGTSIAAPTADGCNEKFISSSCYLAALARIYCMSTRLAGERKQAVEICIFFPR